MLDRPALRRRRAARPAARRRVRGGRAGDPRPRRAGPTPSGRSRSPTCSPAAPCSTSTAASATTTATSCCPGLFFVGDSVATTTPVFGRGHHHHAVAVRGAAEPARPRRATTWPAPGHAFDAWSADTMRPWVEDHIHMDAAHVDRWNGARHRRRRPAAVRPDPGRRRGAARDHGSTPAATSRWPRCPRRCGRPSRSRARCTPAAGARRTPPGRRATSSSRSSAASRPQPQPA